MSDRKNQKLLSSKKSYCSSLETIELLESVRELPPLHYRFKIESFGELNEALKRMKIDHLESSKFSAGGYQWMLYIYPNGKKTENGDGHISLYLKLVDEVAREKEIHATIKFFVYDHLHDRYLIIHDPRGKRFDATITQWGIPRFMALSTFKDPDNGFLINDSCVFGVELLFPGENTSSSITTLLPGLLGTDTNTYVWKVVNFSKLKEDSLTSPVFTLGGYLWELKMYPFGNNAGKGKSLSLYFGPALPGANKLYAEFELCLKDHDNCCKQIKKITSTWFGKDTEDWGFSNFVSLVDLKSPFDEYVQNDTIIIEVKVLAIFVSKDM